MIRRGEDAGIPSSAIQVWPIKEAPEVLRSLVGANTNAAWLALVPAELNDPEVVGLMLRDGEQSFLRVQLSDGALLLAGQFSERGLLRPVHSQPAQPEARKTRSAAR